MTPTYENAIPTRQTNPAKPSLIGSLFSFDRFITPPLVKIIYIIGLVLIPLAMIGSALAMTLYALVAGAGAGFIMTGFFQVIVSVVASLLMILMLRVYCECVAVLFKINNELQAVRERVGKL